MINMIKRHFPLVLVIGFFGVTMIVLLYLSFVRNQAHLVYALDDAYIHMAIAKHLVQNKVWGITKYGFSSSSSSLLWPLLISFVYYCWGVNEVTPFILNVILTLAVIYIIYVFWKREKVSSYIIFIGLLGIVYLTPFPALVFGGMEHLLQILVVVSFIYLSSIILVNLNFRVPLSQKVLLLILGSIIPIVRYEGLFIVAVVCSLFIGRRHPLYALLLSGVSLLPIVVYGIWSVGHGWYFLPNPLLLKGHIPLISWVGVKQIFYRIYDQLFYAKHLLTLVLSSLFILIFQFRSRKTFWEHSSILLFIFIATTFLHLIFAKTGWFYRYEAYLMTMGLFSLVLACWKYFCLKSTVSLRKYISWGMLMIVVFFPVVKRGIRALMEIPQATANIYHQQYQMGLFLSRFYQEAPVAANDMGAINFLADIRCLDLWGLGSLKVAKMKMEGSYNTWRIYNLARQNKIKIAIIYEGWLKRYGGVPPSWIKVGEWKIVNNIVCGEDTVSFYAITPGEEKYLIKALKLFSLCLPPEIEQKGRYINY